MMWMLGLWPPLLELRILSLDTLYMVTSGPVSQSTYLMKLFIGDLYDIVGFFWLKIKVLREGLTELPCVVLLVASVQLPLPVPLLGA